MILEGSLKRSEKKVFSDFLKMRILGIFLSGFLVNFEETKQVLLELNYYDQIVNELLQVYPIIPCGYDVKLFIATISTVPPGWG